MKPFSLYVGLTRCLYLNSRSNIVASASAFVDARWVRVCALEGARGRGEHRGLGRHFLHLCELGQRSDYLRGRSWRDAGSEPAPSEGGYRLFLVSSK